MNTATRIAIVGIGGSGKSTLSRALGELTGLPVYHLDAMYWNRKYIAEPNYLSLHDSVVSKKEWIIEGFIRPEMSQRFDAANLIIILDFSRFICAQRVMSRWFKYRKSRRPELPKGSVEKFDILFLIAVLLKKERRQIFGLLKNAEKKKIIRIHSSRELNILLQALNIKRV